MSVGIGDRLAGLKALRPTKKKAGADGGRSAHGGASGVASKSGGAGVGAGVVRGYVTELPEGWGRLAEMVGGECGKNRYGEFLRVRKWEPVASMESGQGESSEGAREAVRLLVQGKNGEQEAAANLSQWLFLDTETTGLAGGTGTYAFLVGVAWWDAGGLEIEQYFMRDHSEEHALLTALGERMKERRVLVTFNGKSFDWPLLETRYRMTRAIAPRAPRAHLDFLHPARQVWRLRLGSVRLCELERSVLNFRRGPDIESQFIPQYYFDYLRGGRPDELAGVFRHNRMDLVGLGALAAKMIAMLAAPEQAEGDALELYGLSRLLERRGERAQARAVYERALAAGLGGEVERAARRELAMLAKRDRDYSRATSLWEELAGDSAEGLAAYEELAIYYEHHAGEPERAAELTREALAALGEAFETGRITPQQHRRMRSKLEHRRARVEQRAGAKMAGGGRRLFDGRRESGGESKNLI